ncbi:MAG: hypothetical protein ACTHJ4_08450 [Candidatus Nucleicultricaceae bacterium]
MAYYTALKRYAKKHTLPLPSQYEMDMAFGNPYPLFFKGWGPEETFQQYLDQVFLMVDDILCKDSHCICLKEEFKTLN